MREMREMGETRMMRKIGERIYIRRMTNDK
jgi:hypothetical protein